jgi:hypothetical protein
MGLEYHEFHKKWFSGAAPQNAAYASKVFSITGNGADGDWVSIGDEVYEFDTNSSVTSGHILVDISSGGLGAVNCAAKLTAAIEANSTIVDAFDLLHDGNVAIQSKTVGTESNDIALAKSMANAAWDGGATKLSGGKYATPCKSGQGFIVLSGVYYLATEPIDKYNTLGWQKVVPVLVS